MTAEQLGEAIDTVREYLLFIDPDEELNKIVEHIATLEEEITEALWLLSECVDPSPQTRHMAGDWLGNRVRAYLSKHKEGERGKTSNDTRATS